jgi:hypothetical protein
MLDEQKLPTACINIIALYNDINQQTNLVDNSLFAFEKEVNFGFESQTDATCGVLASSCLILTLFKKQMCHSMKIHIMRYSSIVVL